MLQIFQNKLSLADFEENFSAFIKNDVNKDKSLTIRKGISPACDEISALLELAKHYRGSYLKWTGEHTQNHHFDGILFFKEDKEKEQKIEISRVLDEQAKQELKKMDHFSRIFTIKASDFDIESQEGIEHPDTRSFIYHRIVKILRKKESEKYKGCWLCVAYYPYSITSKLNENYVKNPVLEKIEYKEKALLSQIRKIFKKIIFVPSGMDFIKITGNTYRIFEWK